MTETQLLTISRSPGFNHFSIEEERESLEERILSSRFLSLGGYPPILIFGYVDTPESRDLLLTVQQTRMKIQKVIEGNTFEEILPLLFSNFFPELQKPETIGFNEDDLLRTLSSLLEKMRHQDPELFDDESKEEFLRGLQSSEFPPPPLQLMSLAKELYEARCRYEASVNLQLTQAKLREISQDNSIVCVIPDKLFYKVLQKGNGSLEVTDSSVLSVGYYFQDFANDTDSGCLAETPLEDFIPGIARCVRGMKIGEKRELWIHPEYADEDQDLDSQLGFKLQLELFNVRDGKVSQDSDSKSLPPGMDVPQVKKAIPCGRDFESKETERLFNLFTELKKRKAYYFGCNVGQLLRKGLDIAKVAAFLRENSEHSVISLESEENLDRFLLSIFYRQQKQEEEKALKCFSQLSSSTKCMHKNRLYFDLIEEGKGPSVKEDSVIQVKFLTKNHSGSILAQASGDIDLKHTVKGYREGFLGQKAGSKIRLYVHPEFGFQYLSAPIGDSFLITEAEIVSLK